MNEAQTTAPAIPNTKVWVNEEGQYLTVNTSHTHTGHHIYGGFTPDLDKAFVGYGLPRFTNHLDVTVLNPLPAWSVRRVYIGFKRPEPK